MVLFKVLNIFKSKSCRDNETLTASARNICAVINPAQRGIFLSLFQAHHNKDWYFVS